jgi:hypothetical protein
VTFDDRVKALGTRGFTDRQARFLVTVMLHSGVCMVRQYCAFAGMVYGQTARDFFGRLTAHRIATAFDCAHKRARIYHIRNRALYQTIGEPHSRLRKPVTLARAIERVMLLDAVLAAPHLRWLATEGEKVEHFSLTVGSVLRREEFPCLVFGDELDSTVRYFPDRQPIGLDPDGQGHVFLYLVTRSVPIDFRAFLQRHAELLRALPSWTIRLVVPSHLATSREAFTTACRQELASPLRPSVVDELRWFFAEQRRLATANNDLQSEDPDRFARLRRGFSAPRYRRLYRAWTADGDRALGALCSPVLADAITRQRGRIECELLARPYLHLSPLVGTA